MAKFNIDATETKTMSALKDFQRATVLRIAELFENGQKRVLVADEVGMGKTLIARGAIVKTARIRIKEQDPLFKVVYICSNTSIANQNIQKLKVSDEAKIEGVSDTRLSMLHLKISEQESDESLRDGFIQLIPLTPDTSFRLTNGGGTVNERALMFAILSRLKELEPYLDELEKIFVYGAQAAWGKWAKKWYADKVTACESKTGGSYPANVIEKIYEYEQDRPFMEMVITHCQRRACGESPYRDVDVLNKLRVMFARIGTEMLSPDLVIMDEFQRFKFLLPTDDCVGDHESDASILARKFLLGGDTRILLLSATPYKLYYTLDEIDEDQGNDHYSEFLQVMDFLFEDKKSEFRQVWNNYSVALREVSNGCATVIQVKKAAEEAMYAGVCRTERISVMGSGDYIDDSSKRDPLRVSEKDILSYIEAGALLKSIGVNFSMHIDYVKSCPFLLSFMQKYKEKQKIEEYFVANPDEVDKARSDLLWINPSLINDYKELPATNARLEKLKEVAFEGNAELYLWIPPSKPYYALQGAYKNSAGFSKVLVFSSWEMVPRMIGSLISYEAERRTVGKLCRASKNVDKKNARYHSIYRYPYRRLQFSLTGGEPQRMSLFCLLYPSSTLAKLYNPILAMKEGHALFEIERRIKSELRTLLEGLKQYQKNENGPEDAKWYYLAPMLMDGMSNVRQWITSMEKAFTVEDDEGENAAKGRGQKAFQAHVNRLMQYAAEGTSIELGRMPDDLLGTLTDMAIASPAVCLYRANGGNAAFATAIAKVFVDYFNSTESTAIVELAATQYHTKKSDENSHWQDVLLYCKDGCFQAMIDEYMHLIRESVSFSSPDAQAEKMQRIMLNDLRIHTASYEVDTFKNFCAKIRDENGERKRHLMRAHYAVGFVTDGDDKKKSSRKDSIRGAFNCPLKPFVLASTSIGQEGLDFHHYCRRIMHWNLPSNPIDLEQREGRINRFKCLAIRQNVAAKYGNIPFKRDVWEEMFSAAHAEKKEHQSDLVPYWCFGDNQTIKIERILPLYPMSKDEISYERLIKILSLYRLTLGQARQEELLEYIFSECEDMEELKKLFINLSPYSKQITK